MTGIYVLGGLVLTIRLLFDGFTPESIVGVIGSLPRTLVVATALLEVIGPAAALGIALGLIYAFFKLPNPSENPAAGARALLFPVAILLAVPAIAVARANGSSWPLLSTSFVGIFLTWGFLALGWNGLGFVRAHVRGEIAIALAACGVWTLMLIPPAVMLGGAVDFDSAVVCLNDTAHVEAGGLLANTKDQVFLARHNGHKDTVATIPGSRVLSVRQGDVKHRKPALVCPPPKSTTPAADSKKPAKKPKTAPSKSGNG